MKTIIKTEEYYNTPRVSAPVAAALHPLAPRPAFPPFAGAGRGD